MTELDREKIRRDLERHQKNLSDDFEQLKRDLIRLGSTVSDDEELRAKEFRMLEFHASMVQEVLTLCQQVIIHAEYCDTYIVKNEACHADKQSQIDKVREDIKPLIRAKRWYADTKVIMVFIASAIGLIGSLTAYLNWLEGLGK